MNHKCTGNWTRLHVWKSIRGSAIICCTSHNYNFWIGAMLKYCRVQWQPIGRCPRFPIKDVSLSATTQKTRTPDKKNECNWVHGILATRSRTQMPTKLHPEPQHKCWSGAMLFKALVCCLRIPTMCLCSKLFESLGRGTKTSGCGLWFSSPLSCLHLCADGQATATCPNPVVPQCKPACTQQQISWLWSTIYSVCIGPKLIGFDAGKAHKKQNNIYGRLAPGDISEIWFAARNW